MKIFDLNSNDEKIFFLPGNYEKIFDRGILRRHFTPLGNYENILNLSGNTRYIYCGAKYLSYQGIMRDIFDVKTFRY